jgi:phosphoglycerate kinase
MNKLTLNDIEVSGRRVLVRVDFNVPLTQADDGTQSVADDTRIEAALPTIRTIINANGKAILISHLGRPGGQPDPSYSLAPVAERLEELLDKRVRFSSNTTGQAVQDVIDSMPDGSVILLENTRFEPGEKANDEGFAKALAGLADVYVNDAFGAAHRAHASTAGVAQFVPQAAMGLLLKEEVEVLTAVRDTPEHPFVVVLGGAKVSDKIGVIDALSDTADRLLVGGAMSYTFLKAQGQSVGTSLVEEDRLERTREMMDAIGDKLMLPSDHVVAAEMDAEAETQTVTGDIPDGHMGLDIGPATIDAYTQAFDEAATIVWNGPMGVFEMEPFAKGTMAIAEALADATQHGAYTVVGGGDSVAALAASGYTDAISHVSTGGGAMLQLLEGGPLPGVEALTDKQPA